MRVGTNQRKFPTNPYYNMDATRLKIVAHEKDLGVVSNNELKFEDCITRIVKKVNSVMGMIRSNLVFLDFDMFKKLFITIVLCCSMERSLEETNNANRKRTTESI